MTHLRQLCGDFYGDTSLSMGSRVVVTISAWRNLTEVFSRLAFTAPLPKLSPPRGENSILSSEMKEKVRVNRKSFEETGQNH